MSDVCLRNMSCKCSLCAGEDTAMLLSITRSIASAVTYDTGDDDADANGESQPLPPPPPSALGRMANSPPLPSVRKALANSPPSVEAPPAPVSVAEPPPAPVARKSALPSRGVRKSALPARPSIKRTPLVAPDNDNDVVLAEPPPPPPAPVVEVVAPPTAPVAAPLVAPTAALPSQTCQRNMSCTCPLCAGEDTAMLLSISRSIASTVAYENPGETDESDDVVMAPPPPTLGRMTNSPPIPSVRKVVMNSPPPVPVQRQPTVPAPVAPAAAPVAPSSAGSAAPPPSLSLSSDLSVDDVVARLTDANWKLRKEGCEHVKAHCERPSVRPDDVAPFVSLFSRMCDDANAGALEAGVHAVLAYARHVTPFDKTIVPSVMKKLTDKGFSSRPGVVKLCEDVVSAFVEAGAADDTVAALLDGTKNKKPKVPPACCANLLDTLQAFGPRVVPLPALKAALPALCESTVNGVRPIAVNLVAEIHRWTGPALVQDIVANLRQAQKTEYETLTKDMVVGQAAPTKFVRGAARPAATSGQRSGSGAAAATAAASAGAFDPREFAETVDLLAKLPKTEFKAKLALPKWSEKVEALKIVLELIGPVPKLATGDYYELVSTLKLLSTDANVNIVAKAIEVFGALANGLRKHFTPYARTFFPELVRKLSDKKTVILTVTNTTLDLFLQHALSIDLVLDELKAALDTTKNKAPQARVQVLGFLTRAVETKLVNVADKSLMLEFAGLFAAAMDDTDPSVRKAGVDAFIAMLRASEQIATWLQPLVDDVARKNPRSYKLIQQSVGGLGSGGGTTKAAVAKPPAASAATKKPVFAEAMDVDATGPSPAATGAAARLGAKKPMGARGPPSRLSSGGGGVAASEASSKPTAVRKPGGVSTTGGGGDFTPIAISVTPDEAEDVVADLGIENWREIQDGFASAKWTERKAALEQLEAFARATPAALTLRTIEALTLFVSAHVKEFKDSNVNVLKSAFEAVGAFAACCVSKFPRGVVCQLVPIGAEKLSDRKAADAIRTMLLSFCEAVGPAYVLGCLVSAMPAVKAPLAHVEALGVLANCVQDFGVAVCSPRSLIDFAKGAQGLESSNPKVRTSAIALLAAMYAQLGPALLPILALDSWKPALASLVEAEFKKTGFDPTTATASVKRHVKRSDDDSGTTNATTKPVDASALFGRVDISSQLTKELFADMKCDEDMAAWKKRAAAMDAVQSLCEGAGGAIEFTKTVQEALKALKARLNDSNANLKVKAAQVIGVVASSVGPEISKMAKFLGASLVSGVGDNKKTMQTAAVDALHKWVRHNHATVPACVESLLSAVSDGLMNPVGRAELLGWAAEHLKSCDKLDLNGLVVPTVQCLLDKSSDAREKAQVVLAEVIRSVGPETVLTTGCRDMKPAQMRTLRPLILKVCESTTSGSVPPVAPPVAVAVATPAASAVMDTPTRTGVGASRLAKTGVVSLKAGGLAVRSSLARPGSFRGGGSDAPALSEGSEDGDASTPSTALLLKMNTSKSARLARTQSTKWLFDVTSASELSSRKADIEAEWKPFVSPELHAKLFAPTLEKGMLAAITDLMTCASTQPHELVAALDLVLKWCSLRLVDNNVQALAKLLDFLVKLFDVLKSVAYQLDDVEAAIFLPYLLQESGQSKPRFRVRFRDIMKLVADVYSREKYVTYLVECLSTCKNLKSRCECIDLVEYLVTTVGFHVVGKKGVKEVGKYVTAHEKELRESALNALVAVYTRTDGNVDKFFRFAGVTSQQGMDLLTMRIKHLPPGSLQDSSSVLQQPSGGLGATGAPPMSPALAYTQLPRPVSSPPLRLPTGGRQQLTNGVLAAPVQPPYALETDEDADMTGLSLHDEPQDDDDDDAQDSIEELLLRPIDRLLTATKDVVDESSPHCAAGMDALKGLYAIIDRPSDESELAFLRFYVSDIAVKLCDLIHASFRPVESKQPLAIHVLSLSLSVLKALLASDAIDNIQRYAVERVVLELCTQMRDPRMTEFFVRPSTEPPLTSALLSPERRRLLLLCNALAAAMRVVTDHMKAGEVFPSVINLLQRIVRNDVGDYNARDAYHHLMNADSLDQVVGRLLLQLARDQANAMHPFEGVDLFGVLMQMHSFFSTLPQTDLFAVQVANDNMQAALRIIAESLLQTRPSSFEASLSDLPLPSPVRDLLTSMGLSGAAPRGSNGSVTVTAAAPVEPVTRRLFETGPAPATTSATASVRASFTTFNEFSVSRASASAAARASGSGAGSERVNSSASGAASASQLLRERLERVRQF